MKAQIRERLEKLGLPLHVIPLPQWKSVKFFYLHAEDIIE